MALLADYPSGFAPTFQAQAGDNILAGSLTVSAAKAEATGVTLFEELLLRAAAGHYVVNITATSKQVDHHHPRQQCHVATTYCNHPQVPLSVLPSNVVVTIVVTHISKHEYCYCCYCLVLQSLCMPHMQYTSAFELPPWSTEWQSTSVKPSLWLL